MKLHETARKGIETIREDRRYGARELSLLALDVLVDVVETSTTVEPTRLLGELRRATTDLESVRPSMAPIANAVRRVQADLPGILEASGGLLELKKDVLQRIDEEKMSIKESTEKIVDHAVPLLSGKRVMTHSYSSTVLEVLLKAEGSVPSVTVTESRPLFEGRRLAKRLSAAGIPVTLITDASAGHFISEVDIVLVGADSILPDGSVVNKIGTLLLALAARERGIPFHVVSDTYKWAERVELEEKGPEEVSAEPSSGVQVRNVYFDRTPAHLVSSIVTELGVFTPAQFSSAMKERPART